MLLLQRHQSARARLTCTNVCKVIHLRTLPECGNACSPSAQQRSPLYVFNVHVLRAALQDVRQAGEGRLVVQVQALAARLGPPGALALVPCPVILRSSIDSTGSALLVYSHEHQSANCRGALVGPVPVQ